MADYPEPLEDDPDAVVTALEVGAALWERGETTEAVHWLRKAVDEAFDAGMDDRGLSLSKLAAGLASIPPSVPVPAPSAVPAAIPAPAAAAHDDAVRPVPEAASTPAPSKMRPRTPAPPPPSGLTFESESAPASGPQDSSPPVTPPPSRTGRPIARAAIPRATSRSHRAAQSGPPRRDRSFSPAAGPSPTPPPVPTSSEADAESTSGQTPSEAPVASRTRTLSGVSNAATPAPSEASAGEGATTETQTAQELAPPVVESEPPTPGAVALLSDEQTLAAYPIAPVKIADDPSARPTFDPKFMSPFAMPTISRTATPPRPVDLAEPPVGSTRPALPDDIAPPLANEPVPREEATTATGVVPIAQIPWQPIVAVRVVVTREAGKVVLRPFEQAPPDGDEVEAFLVACDGSSRLMQLLRGGEPSE